MTWFGATVGGVCLFFLCLMVALCFAMDKAASECAARSCPPGLSARLTRHDGCLCVAVPQ